MRKAPYRVKRQWNDRQLWGGSLSKGCLCGSCTNDGDLMDRAINERRKLQPWGMA